VLGSCGKVLGSCGKVLGSRGKVLGSRGKVLGARGKVLGSRDKVLGLLSDGHWHPGRVCRQGASGAARTAACGSARSTRPTGWALSTATRGMRGFMRQSSSYGRTPTHSATAGR